ncbi:molybdopterin-guanine dinucleotide biosynthesis protein A [Gracilibacillus orientalis]|uniref:Probable molybdenum cofactor guanylyltransferase n=1 Tax=Gracilibacillus orientalis TaxID=334253 RepID=A0A1I4QEK3_9BACI|nr:molybdenum cofactor guanylyltransferase [Gracilibacillus orientalis]SFM38454.1 molybdopterin-guanine dinucleotide biosynthesis protein A [Gracilibacillus orientalis]
MEIITGIVLTGGKSSRFKRDKAFASYKGNLFYENALEVMLACVDNTFLVIRDNQPLQLESENIKVITDHAPFKGKGPLAGIYSAMMEEGAAKWYLVLPVDTPLMEQSILKKLITYIDANVDAIVPRVNARVQPLVALYKLDAMQVMERQLLAEKRSMHQLLKKLTVTYVDFHSEDEKYFININTQEDYQRYVGDKMESEQNVEHQKGTLDNSR